MHNNSRDTNTKESRLQTILECSNIGTWEWNVQTGETVFNETWAKIIGYTLAELAPVSIDTWQRLAHPDDLAESHKILLKHYDGEIPYYEVECRMKHKEGHWVWVHDRGKVISWTDDGKPLKMLGSHEDITARKKAEEDLQDSEEKFRALFEKGPIGVAYHQMVYDEAGNPIDYRFLDANSSYLELTGVDPRGKLVTEAFPGIEKDPFDWIGTFGRVAKTGEQIRFEQYLQPNNRWYDCVGYQVKQDYFVAAFMEITERKKAEQALQRVDKLDSLSVLAGGIAHDFNNLLSGIFGYIEIAKEECSTESLASKYLDEALKVFDRAKDLTLRLLTFSKGGAPKRKTGQIGKLLKENASFVLTGSNVRCDYTISKDLWLCDFDENQIGQVIDNIVLNAKQAMPMGGVIHIEATNVCIENSNAQLIPAGNYIKISIADTGVGIPQAHIKQIFDPFFTTKQKGNGLGLATSYSIVQKHGGYLDVESVPEKGSVFNIYLPATDKKIMQTIPQKQAPHHGKGHILVMDDEQFMRALVGKFLELMGYTMIPAINGEEALHIGEQGLQQGYFVSAAIFDLTVPGGMGGKDAVIQFKKLYPDVPVFASSGFSKDPVMAQPKEYGFTDSICKPFKKDELAQMLSKYLS
jgi:PAS domain S-box-containing protein